MAVGIDDPPETPAVLLTNRRRFRSGGTYRLRGYGIRIVDDEQGPAGPPTNASGAEAMQVLAGRRHPEAGVTDRQLLDNVIVVANTVKGGCAEGRLIEPHSFADAINPSLRLNACQRES